MCDKTMKKKLDRLNIEFDEGFDDTPEKAQQYNFMAYMYLYWKFEERPNAFAFIERVENLKEGTNTITQCNKITFYIELGEYAQSAKL